MRKKNEKKKKKKPTLHAIHYLFIRLNFSCLLSVFFSGQVSAGTVIPGGGRRGNNPNLNAKHRHLQKYCVQPRYGANQSKITQLNRYCANHCKITQLNRYCGNHCKITQLNRYCGNHCKITQLNSVHKPQRFERQSRIAELAESSRAPAFEPSTCASLNDC